MGIHLIDGDKVVEYEKKTVGKEFEIEDFLESHPKVLDKDIFIIGRQVPTATKTRIDLMGLDRDGNVVIIEVKKGVSAREVVSQILEYGVWAEDIQYEDLNRIAKDRHISGFQDLYKKYEIDYKEIPEPFNQNQRLYIVAEKIDEKIEDICRYLRVRGIDIKCVELNFFEKNGQRLVNTKVVVGTKETIYQELGDDIKTEKIGWKDKIERASPENKKNVTDLISKIEQTFDCKGEPHNRWYYLHTMKDGKRGSTFAAVICGKDTARIAFRIDPAKFNFDDERISIIKGWFFSKDSERRIHIVPENIDLIFQCLRHAYDVTMEYFTGEKERQSEAAQKAWKTRREMKNSDASKK